MNGYIDRAVTQSIIECLEYYPVIVITGPRQSGKTALCRHIRSDYQYINLEELTTRALAESDPVGFMANIGSRAIIDEVQNVPRLLSQIQVMVDNDPNLQYILTGSCNFELIQSISQSLSGRAAMFTLLPFSLKEIKLNIENLTTGAILLNGQYPGVVANNIPASIFYKNYYQTYIERDIRNLLKIQNLIKFDSFCRMLGARVGSELNASTMSRELGVSATTINDWFSILTSSYITFKLPPYYNNISKRLTKMPKIYFYDTGLLCYLLGIETAEQLQNHAMQGAIFENLVISELVKTAYNSNKEPRISFFREHSGREVDAIVENPAGLSLLEIKIGKTYKPEYAKNLKSVAEDLQNVAQSSVIYDGENLPPLAINFRNL